MGGWILFGVVFLAAAAADLVSKEIVFRAMGMPGESLPATLVPGMIWIETSLNEGALFGMGQGFGRFFAAVSAVALTIVLGVVARADTRRSRWLVAALGLIAGGIVGNLYDRLGLPGLTWHAPLEREGERVFAVRDWIHFHLEGIIDWPIFNLADSWLVIGSATLVALSFLAGPEPTAEATSPAGGDAGR